METFAAVLTAVFFGAFFAYLTIGNRLEARKHAGRLLLKANKKAAFGRFVDVALVASAISGFAVFVYILSSNAFFFAPMPIGMLLLFFFNMPQIGWMVILRIINSQIEFRRHGILTPTNSNGPLFFVPWSHIRYCKWLWDDGTLLLQFKDRNEQIKVNDEEVEKITTVLIEHVEIRDSNGETLNAQRLPFEYPEEPTPLQRRMLQFNLKTALLFMVVASSAFAWLGIHLRAGWKEQEALAQLEEFGAQVGYRNGWVYSLDFSKSTGSFTDDELRHVAAFRYIRRLNLSKKPITDSGLAHIKGLTGLTNLNLSNTEVTDSGLSYIEEMHRLRTLQLDNTKISDNGLMHLKSLTRLERLSLCGTGITDAGLVHIESLTCLNILNLDRTQVTDDGLMHLKPLSQLESLTLRKTEVTDAGIARVEDILDLKNISFDNPQRPAVKAVSPAAPQSPAIQTSPPQPADRISPNIEQPSAQ